MKHCPTCACGDLRERMKREQAERERAERERKFVQEHSIMTEADLAWCRSRGGVRQWAA
jgi:hypothetical protein